MQHHLVLTQGATYCGRVRADKDHPDIFVEDGPDYEAAMNSGFFREVGAGIPVPVEDPEDDGLLDLAEDEEPEEEEAAEEAVFSKMTIGALLAYAQIHGIDVDPKMKKADILETIKAAEEKADKIRATMRAE